MATGSLYITEGKCTSSARSPPAAEEAAYVPSLASLDLSRATPAAIQTATRPS
jgi:hypothetical protein